MAFEITTMSAADRLAWQASLGVPGVSRVTVSAADLLNIHATPKLIVPTPGAGKFISMISFWSQLKFISQPFSGDMGISTQLQYGSGDPDDPSTVRAGDINVLFDVTESTFYPSQGSNPGDAAISAIANQGIYLSRQVEELADGDGILTIGVLYTIESVA